jgi:hypothetical protein
MIKFFLFLVIMIVTVFYSCSSNPVVSDPDKIEIIYFQPDSGIIANSLTLFSIRIHYILVSADSGLISIGFNTFDPNSFIMATASDTVVPKGEDSLTLHALVKPINWGNHIAFAVFAGISKYPHDEASWPNSATDIKKYYFQ